MEVYTDTGYFLYQTIKINSFISYETSETYIDYRENCAFVLVSLRKYNEKEVYEKAYAKIQ